MFPSRAARAFAVLATTLGVAACSTGATIGPSPIGAHTATPSPAASVTLAPGATPTPTLAPGTTPTPSPSPTRAGSATPSPTPTPTATATSTSVATAGKIGHVWLIVEENESESATFGAGMTSQAPYLANTLKNQGAYLANYYSTGHVSLDNYIAMMSGQPPSAETTSDCTVGFNDFEAVTTDPTTGVAVGQGCVYPTSILTFGDQMNAAGLMWREYAEDMGDDATRDNTTATPFACGHPNPGFPTGQMDPTQSEEAADAYATRHNPFMYFHSIIDVTTGANACANHVVNLQHYLQGDLATVATTPKFSFITPALCDDGHDTGCAEAGADGTTGGLPGLDAYLKNTLIPEITNSPAYKQDGLIIVTFDEAATSDTTSCCNEFGQVDDTPTYGGGLIGAVMLSPFIKGPVVDMTSYNHYSLLHFLEDTFGITAPTINGTPYLGYAFQGTDFSKSDFNNL